MNFVSLTRTWHLVRPSDFCPVPLALSASPVKEKRESIDLQKLLQMEDLLNRLALLISQSRLTLLLRFNGLYLRRLEKIDVHGSSGDEIVDGGNYGT